MKTFLIALMISACSVQAVSAQFENCAPHVQLRHEVFRNEGEPGIWFHRDVADCMLFELEMVNSRKRHIQLLEERLELDVQLLDNLKLRLEVQGDQLTATMQMLTDSQNNVADLKSELGAWYRSSWLWAGVGVVGTLLGAWAFNTAFGD